MDLESGVWCTPLGHCHAGVNAVIKKQLDLNMHAGFCYSGSIVEIAAESVLSVTGFEGGQCVFLCSGSEAIELARQIAKNITDKPLSMTLHDSYLGSYSSVTNRAANWYLFDWEDCKTCPDGDNCQPDCKKLKAIPDTLSEFIFEPGSSSGFVRFPPKKLIQNITDIVRSNGGKIIVNEVTTGIGRTGKWFGYNHYQIEPDMVAMGKGIGNGYPVSVTAINKNTIEALNEKNTFSYMQSHQNDPLGAAIVHKIIETLKAENLISKANAKGTVFLDMLQQLKESPHIQDVRGRGLMFAVDIKNEQIANRLFKELIEKGYIVCNRKTSFRIDPPLIITEDEFSRFINDFKLLV